eukprot:TRINITY_DN1338_c0_g1_i1.p1 TRINITY_DN1338_c0_g1~~TRINITY_DN1338_c0_g1_i1.p1  ORF type:complete len:423 (-),score=148.70 TRINITY_DN1338_c0_g1_i1:21-1262(-)
MMKSIILALAVLISCTYAKTPVEIIGANVGNPIKAIYVDWHLNWNAPGQSIIDAATAGYNVIIISFYLSSGSTADMAQAWAALDDATKQSVINQVHGMGAVVTVSLGGSTDSPYDKDANTLGQQVAQWAKSQYLDGVDFDLENINQGFTVSGMSDTQTVQWIADLTIACAKEFGQGAVISHAPQAPYFGRIGGSSWAGSTGGYSGVYNQAAQAITYFNIQFYNQGSSCYADYNGLFIQSGQTCSVFPGTSVQEIHVYGVDMNKIVVGKPVTTADASNGWVSGSDLHNFFNQAASDLGWNAGVMGWVWNDQATCTSWIQDIYPGGSNSGGVSSSISGNSATSATSATSSNTGTGTGTSSSNTGSSSTSGGGCSGKATGMYCTDSTHFEWCPSGTVQQCAAGTTCQQNGDSIECV